MAKELRFTQGCIALTLLGATLVCVDLFARAAQRPSISFYVELLGYGLIVTGLLYGGVVYQVTRLGYLNRRPVGAENTPDLDALYREAQPSLLVLVPSYKEELTVLRQTVLSALLMEYPNRRLAVLLDDPPNGSLEDLADLAAARRMVTELDRQLRARAALAAHAVEAFRLRRDHGLVDPVAEGARLSQAFEAEARWVLSLDAGYDDGPEHVQEFFRRAILEPAAGRRRSVSTAFATGQSSLADLELGYHRLAALCDAPLESFERKQYANLSHAPNKAMNLNAYLGLVGGSYYETVRDDVLLLEPASPAAATFTVPAAQLVLTLDADSLVLADYAALLAAILKADPAVAVAQTPYSAFPCARLPLERMAGATTDLQYIVHQGFTGWNATYWVGANALLRYEALVSIQTWTEDRGHRTPVFIQDRTVIEDTGSTIDLVRQGWRLHNHPQRLAYSATPPDFGALNIQRRRWSNGGLIILADLLDHWLRRRGCNLGEGMLRLHYLLSPTIANLGLLLLLLVPFDDRVATVWLPISALPYYLCYGRDLAQNGYRWRDLPRIYALNLVLLPVNLAGVGDSLRQLVTGRKSAFARTPKIGNRTASPVGAIVFLWAMMVFLAGSAVHDVFRHNLMHAGFAAVNLVFFAYGFGAFLGWREAWADVRAAARRWRRARAPIPAPPPAAVEAAAHARRAA